MIDPLRRFVPDHRATCCVRGENVAVVLIDAVLLYLSRSLRRVS